MLRAKEARELMPINRAKETLDEIETMIRKEAENGGEFIIFRKIPFGSYFFEKSYNRVPEDIEALCLAVIDTLTEHGYIVTEYCMEKQFADMGMKISWVDQS